LNLKKTSNIRLLLSILHLGLGVLMLFGAFSKVYSFLVFGIGVIWIIKSENRNNEAAYFSAYMVGAEVLFRMSGGLVLYELPKYSILIFLIAGLLVEKRAHHISISYIIYILLLLIGISFVDIPFNASIRKAIAFNLSGPILLGISAIYFYNRKLNLNNYISLLFYMGLPIISMLSYLYFKTPNLDRIYFNSEANLAASGGYGPNQVATILGVGIFIFLIHSIHKKRIFNLFIIDFFFLAYISFRGLLTFSRGGLLTAIIAICAFGFFYMLTEKGKLEKFVKFSGIIFLFGASLWIYTLNVTDGMIYNRYTNRSTLGIQKKDITTGRLVILKSEFESFLNNPFFGIGVGGSKFYRARIFNKKVATHNEMGRLLSEHGMIGVLALFILILIPTVHILKQPLYAMAFLSAALIFWFLTINHSAMRIAFPAFIYGLSIVKIIPNNE